MSIYIVYFAKERMKNVKFDAERGRVHIAFRS